jgi:DNA-binding HxlR family transcriptional regulator
VPPTVEYALTPRGTHILELFLEFADHTDFPE